MIDGDLIIEDCFLTLTMQFSFIGFFFLYAPEATAVIAISNLIVLFGLIHFYSSVLRRPINVKMEDIGVWNSLFTVISFSSLFYSCLVILFFGNTQMVYEDEDNVQHALLEFIYSENIDSRVLSMIVGGLIAIRYITLKLKNSELLWITKRIQREDHQKRVKLAEEQN